MPAYRLHNGIKVIRVNISGRPGEGKEYRFFLKRDGEILAGGQSFSEAELEEFLNHKTGEKSNECAGD